MKELVTNNTVEQLVTIWHQFKTRKYACLIYHLGILVPWRQVTVNK
jgi:hypothetical protein